MVIHSLNTCCTRLEKKTILICPQVYNYQCRTSVTYHMLSDTRRHVERTDECNSLAWSVYQHIHWRTTGILVACRYFSFTKLLLTRCIFS